MKEVIGFISDTVWPLELSVVARLACEHYLPVPQWQYQEEKSEKKIISIIIRFKWELFILV